MGTFTLGIYPFVLGIGFLIPLDLLFSCCFFWALWKAQLLFGSVMGWKTSAGVSSPVYPYVSYQGFGAYMGLFLIILSQNRKHLGRIFNSLITDDTNAGDSGEPVSYRIPVLVLVSGLVLLLVFCLRAGMSWWVSAIFFYCISLFQLLSHACGLSWAPPCTTYIILGRSRLWSLLWAQEN